MALRTLTRWYGKVFNAGVARRLRSGGRGALSRTHLLITFAGRKTGKRYTIPVNYRDFSEKSLVVLTEAPWWRNLEGGAEVELLIEGETLAGHAEPLAEGESRDRAGRALAGWFWPLFSKSSAVIEVTLEGR